MCRCSIHGYSPNDVIGPRSFHGDAYTKHICNPFRRMCSPFPLFCSVVETFEGHGKLVLANGNYNCITCEVAYCMFILNLHYTHTPIYNNHLFGAKETLNFNYLHIFDRCLFLKLLDGHILQDEIPLGIINDMNAKCGNVCVKRFAGTMS